MADQFFWALGGFLAANFLFKGKKEEKSTPVPKSSSPLEERTYIMLKPDGTQRALLSDIIGRFERRGYKLVAIKILTPSKELAEAHYAEHKGKPFFPKLVNLLTSGPVVGMVWEGKEVVKTGRAMIGMTSPAASPAGTIRGDLAIDMGRNVIHGSDSVESGLREASLWFPEGIAQWSVDTKKWIYEQA